MATSNILAAINTTLTQLRSIRYDWGLVEGSQKSRPAKLFQKVAVFNGQPARMKSGQGNLYELPAAFLEMVPGPTMQLLENVTFTDMCVKVRILHGQLNTDDDEGMDQNLTVYEIRDLVKSEMVGFQPDNCGTLFCDNEQIDYDHETLYEYVLDFKAGFTDTKGSILDADQTKVIYTTPPTNLELQTGFIDGGAPAVDPLTSYIWKVCEVRALIVDVPDPLNTQTLDNGEVIPLEYALRDDNTLYIPYLMSTPGIGILTPFMIDNQPTPTVSWLPVEGEGINVFYNSAGGFGIGDQISFNASLPLGVGA